MNINFENLKFNYIKLDILILYLYTIILIKINSDFINLIDKDY